MPAGAATLLLPAWPLNTCLDMFARVICCHLHGGVSLFFLFSPQQSMHSALSEHCFHLTSLLPSDYFLLLLHSRQKGLLLLLSVSDSTSLLFPLFSAPSMTCICSGCQSRVTEAEQRGGCLRAQPLLFLFSFDYSCAIPD